MWWCRPGAGRAAGLCHTESARMPFLPPADRESPSVAAGPWSFTLRVDDPCFAGHFDDTPVLPGIAHVAIALEAYGRLYPAPGVLVAVDDLRFLQPLLPGDRCEVRVTPVPPAARVEVGGTPAQPAARFEIRRAGALASSGHRTFAAGAVA